MHERVMTLATHRLDHPQRGQRVDERRGALLGRRSRRKRKRVRRAHDPVRRIRRRTEDRDHAPDERRRVRARRYDGARAFVAHRQRPPHSSRYAAPPAFRNVATVETPSRRSVPRSAGPNKIALVGRVDRRRLHAHDDLIIAGSRQRHIGNPQFDGPFRCDGRLQYAGIGWSVHALVLDIGVANAARSGGHV
jgi:hypothetical protein